MERFFREARAVARLDHSNIVSVHDAGFDNGRCWVAYQLVGGRPLWWYRDHHRMDPTTIARIVADLADALDHSHQRGVVHRDLKPANVLIDDQGRPRLIDFGLARRFDLESDLTREGAVVGTPAYMSPEQALGQSRQVDERSDVYSLGVILHELLYGRRPDEPGETLAAKSRGQLGDSAIDSAANPPASSDLVVPPVLKKICSRAIALDPAARHPTARALADELNQWLQEQKTAGARSSPFAFRTTAATVAALLLLCALAVALVYWNNQPGLVVVRNDHRPASKNAPKATLVSPGAPACFALHREPKIPSLPHTGVSGRGLHETGNQVPSERHGSQQAGLTACSNCNPESKEHSSSRPLARSQRSLTDPSAADILACRVPGWARTGRRAYASPGHPLRRTAVLIPFLLRRNAVCNALRRLLQPKPREGP